MKLALMAPLAITFMGLILGIENLFMGGLAFTALILAAGFFRRMS